MREVRGWAAPASGAALVPWDFERREPGDRDIAVRIRYCGVCASDLAAVRRGDPAAFPLVPGHEIVGEVAAVGAAVSRFSVGDQVAVGNIVDSCRVCAACRAGRENWCHDGVTLTYGGTDRVGGARTQGGFSAEYVVDEHFAYPVPSGLDPAGVAPLMCAGITTYVPLRRWGAGPGRTVGVVGMGGLGHIALKLAHAMGAEVVQFTTSPAKAAEARRMGADDVVHSRDERRMAEQAGRFDLILDTVGAPHALEPYLGALAIDGTLCMVGIPEQEVRVNPLSLIVGAKSLAGAGSGGTGETREMLDFCAEHGITAETEVLPADEVESALDRLARNDVRYRFVLDMGH
ncbi:putative zinc-type alcohol dehydrogenase-like protein [Murinocardiopsis flavida]|uniref:alcohol dehydrogenase (NADP(+)) n=1 Tax=Murinocardiopsis flavida TaxID=645275 RepID=A0A2P8DNL8_9ACTN|nr:NAD(P)-dependent alcohol dehydrogenase [Murinocardiopsis flavida]PSK98799.1 putative zinc-type alcohol dehydrogenase-like protein [Murinocardiopsis flavida]